MSNDSKLLLLTEELEHILHTLPDKEEKALAFMYAIRTLVSDVDCILKYARDTNSTNDLLNSLRWERSFADLFLLWQAVGNLCCCLGQLVIEREFPSSAIASIHRRTFGALRSFREVV